jgi:hypothetical protein
MVVSLEDALDECVQSLEREDMNACLRRYPQMRDDLEPLLRVAVALRVLAREPGPPTGPRMWLRLRLGLRPEAARFSPV